MTERMTKRQLLQKKREAIADAMDAKLDKSEYNIIHGLWNEDEESLHTCFESWVKTCPMCHGIGDIYMPPVTVGEPQPAERVPCPMCMPPRKREPVDAPSPFVGGDV